MIDIVLREHVGHGKNALYNIHFTVYRLNEHIGDRLDFEKKFSFTPLGAL